MFLVGTSYNFCWTHKSMRREREISEPPGGKWVPSTPAQAAGLADDRCSVEELLSFRVPPPQRERYPSGAGGDRNGWWRQRVQPDHGSMWYYPHSRLTGKIFQIRQKKSYLALTRARSLLTICGVEVRGTREILSGKVPGSIARVRCSACCGVRG